MALVFVHFTEFAPLIKRAETKRFSKIKIKIKISSVNKKQSRNQKPTKVNDVQEFKIQASNNKRKIFIKLIEKRCEINSILRRN